MRKAKTHRGCNSIPVSPLYSPHRDHNSPLSRKLYLTHHPRESSVNSQRFFVPFSSFFFFSLCSPPAFADVFPLRTPFAFHPPREFKLVYGMFPEKEKYITRDKEDEREKEEREGERESGREIEREKKREKESPISKRHSGVRFTYYRAKTANFLSSATPSALSATFFTLSSKPKLLPKTLSPSFPLFLLCRRTRIAGSSFSRG